MSEKIEDFLEVPDTGPNGPVIRLKQSAREGGYWVFLRGEHHQAVGLTVLEDDPQGLSDWLGFPAFVMNVEVRDKDHKAVAVGTIKLPFGKPWFENKT